MEAVKPIQMGCLRGLLVLLLLHGLAWPQQPATSPSESEVEELSLERAVALALKENRQIKIASLEIDKFNDRLAVARTHRLPHFELSLLATQLINPIEFNFKKGDLGSLTGIGPVPATDVTVKAPRRPALFITGSVFQPLSQQYRLGLVDRKIETGREIAKEQLRAKQLEIVSNVKRAYYAVLQSQSALRSVEQTLKLYQELDRVTDQYVVQQVALRADSLEVKTRVQKIVYEAMTLRDQLEDHRERLNQLLGRDIRTGFRVSPVPELIRYEVDLNEAREMALAKRPEVNEARLKVQAAEYDRRIKKSEYIPDLSVGVRYVSVQDVKLLPQNILQAGFQLTWEPFDWGRKRHEMAEIGKTAAQAETGLRETQNLILIEVGDKFRKLGQSRQALITAQMGQDAALENVRVLNARYSMQEALIKDVLQSQTALAEANHQYQQALLSFWTAKADFEKAIGAEQ
jgi:outer membrane protein TolC